MRLLAAIARIKSLTLFSFFIFFFFHPHYTTFFLFHNTPLLPFKIHVFFCCVLVSPLFYVT